MRPLGSTLNFGSCFAAPSVLKTLIYITIRALGARRTLLRESFNGWKTKQIRRNLIRLTAYNPYFRGLYA